MVLYRAALLPAGQTLGGSFAHLRKRTVAWNVGQAQPSVPTHPASRFCCRPTYFFEWDEATLGFVIERLFLAPGPKIFLEQYRPKADIAAVLSDVRFSNRPFGVKHFQTIRRCSVDVTHGLVLLFGIGTKALVWGFFSQEV